MIWCAKDHEVQHQRCMGIMKLSNLMATDEWPSESEGDNIVEMSKKAVCAVGYGDGYTIDDVSKRLLF